MKLALNGATTMRADLATDLLAAKAAEFDYLEIWAAKLRAFLKERSTAELKDLFAESGLAPLSNNTNKHNTKHKTTTNKTNKHKNKKQNHNTTTNKRPRKDNKPRRLPK